MTTVTFREDYWYSEERVVGRLTEELGIGERSARRVFEELIEFVAKLKASVEILQGTIYRDLDVESLPPTYDPVRRAINFGQWLGNYRFQSDVLGRELAVRIIPKIEAQYFQYMLNDSLRIIDMVGLPAIEPVFRNLRGLGYASEAVAYSLVLQQYTELALRENPPMMVAEVEEHGEAVLGTPDYAKTLAYMAAGVPMAVATRRVVTQAVLPAIILAKFHLRVLSALNKLVNELRTARDVGDASFLLCYLMLLRNYHLYILTSEILYPFVAHAQAISMEEAELVEEARRQAGTSWWFRTIIDLYMAFCARMPLTYRFEKVLEREAPLQPLPTSKVYELWVLKLLAEALFNGRRPYFKGEGGGFRLFLGDRELLFNLKRGEWSKLIGVLAPPPQPDFILAGRERRAVADAKYKTDLDTGDIERMIAYVADYAEPQDHRDGEVKGFLVMLKQIRPAGLPMDSFRGIERMDLSPRLRIYMTEADPARPDEAREATRLLCGKIFG